MSIGTPYSPQEAPARPRSLTALTPSLLLVIVAALLTLPASLAAWEARVLLDRDGFVAVGNDILSEKAVQQALAQNVSEDLASVRGSARETPLGQLLGQNAPELTNLLDILGGPPAGSPAANTGEPPLLESIALELLAEVPNTPAADVALAITHAEVVAAVRSGVIRAEGRSIVLDLGDALAVLLPARGALGTAILPENAGTVEVTRASDHSMAFRLARWFDGRALLLALLPLAVFAAGFFLAPSWPRYAIQAGVALAVSAALWALLVMVALKPMVIDGDIKGESARAAATAAYGVIAMSFAQQELLVIGVGVVVAAIGLVLSPSGQQPTQSQAS